MHMRTTFMLHLEETVKNVENSCPESLERTVAKTVTVEALIVIS